MIGELLPSTVATAHRTDDAPDAVPLPAEEHLVARAVASRRREFATTRACAREALALLGGPALAGVPPLPLLSGPAREPLWPPGIVGSLTHCAGYRAAAVARATDLAALGIDAEPHAALPDGVLTQVASPAERAALDRLPPGLHGDRVLFSAKESVYKAWYPLAGRWLGFEDAALDLRPRPDDPATGTVTARLLVPGPEIGGLPLTTMTGRYAVRNGLVLTAIIVPGAGPARPAGGG